MKRSIVAILAIILLATPVVYGVKENLPQWAERRIENNFQNTDEYQTFLAAKEMAGSPEYEQARELADSNIPEAPAPDDQSERIYVFFADNSSIQVDYFWDEALQTPIESAYCALEPGDSIYASEPVCKNAFTDKYSFEGFRIAEFMESSALDHNALTIGGKCIFTAQEDDLGKSYMIEPLGRYENRTLRLRAYWTDAHGMQHGIDDGTWLKNEKPISPVGVSVDPFEDYTVKYQYDNERYYYVAASPSPWRSGESIDAGQAVDEVEFSRESSMNGQTSFSVELHPYSNLIISGQVKEIVSVQKSGENVPFDAKGKEITLPKLTPRDYVLIVTDKSYKLSSAQIAFDEPEPLDAGWRYTVHISADLIGDVGLRVERCSSKDIPIDVPDENGFFGKIWGNLSGWASGLFSKGQDAPLLTIDNAQKTFSYTYGDLQNKKTFPLSEPNRATVTIHTDSLPEGTLILTVNDETSYRFGAQAGDSEISFAYSELSKLHVALQQ